jgi:glycosyltransferase A (GT-A) superfamily protein (DUF2064 family)
VVDIKSLTDWQTIETFFCEIKSGDASFERSQREGMQSLAENHRVLKIRVDVEDLPREYTLRVETV